MAHGCSQRRQTQGSCTRAMGRAAGRTHDEDEEEITSSPMGRNNLSSQPARAKEREVERKGKQLQFRAESCLRCFLLVIQLMAA